ncbi:MAG: hypothetical protein AAF721_10805 [Myxococcota bacterium]
MLIVRRHALVGALLLVATACGLRQNLRNEFLSFRGVWFCQSKDCKESEMKRSAKGTDEGGTRIAYGVVQPNAALVFNAGADVETFSATVTDCKGKTHQVADEDLRKPGSHSIAGQGDSWVVMIDKSNLGELTFDTSDKCGKIIVAAQATWPKGTSYEDKGGIKAE